MFFFIITAIANVSALILGCLFGGYWVWLAFALMSILIWVADRTIKRSVLKLNAEDHYPAGTVLLLTLGMLFPIFVFIAVWSLSQTGTHTVLEKLVLAASFALFFGQVGHPCAHELIHRPGRFMRYLGKTVYTSFLIGHHASAHPLVHHIHVATPEDPNSPPKNMGFWRYLPRAWWGSFVKGLRAENAKRARAQDKKTPLSHPYIFYVGGALAMIIIIGWGFGLSGLIVFFGIAIYTNIIIFASDYIQHYGLCRKRKENGKFEPVGPEHSWNAVHFGSSATMLNATRHSDHHMNPLRHYPSLRLSPEMPLLPRPMPVMGAIAFFPPLWRRIMNPRLDALGRQKD